MLKFTELPSAAHIPPDHSVVQFAGKHRSRTKAKAQLLLIVLAQLQSHLGCPTVRPSCFLFPSLSVTLNTKSLLPAMDKAVGTLSWPDLCFSHCLADLLRLYSPYWWYSLPTSAFTNDWQEGRTSEQGPEKLCLGSSPAFTDGEVKANKEGMQRIGSAKSQLL